MARRSGGNQAGSNLDKRQLEAVHSEPVCRLSLSVNPVQMTFSSAKTVAYTSVPPHAARSRLRDRDRAVGHGVNGKVLESIFKVT